MSKRLTWRCFHCGYVALNSRDAAEHFGDNQHATPICQIARHENGLVPYIRRLERELNGYREEMDPLTMAYCSLQLSVADAVRRAEEDGYAKGVQDMIKLGYLTDPPTMTSEAASQAEPPSPRTCEAAQPNEKSGTRGEVA